MVYCDNRKCPRTDCIRRLQYGPFGVVLRVARYNEDLKKKCEKFLSEEEPVLDNKGEMSFVQEKNGQMALF